MAAGLGFKTFTTGEVLTAADTNGYLMQGVLVFASAAARDAAITSPQEGQCCYLKDTDAVLTYSGAAWVGFDDSNAIQNSIVDAKGDLVAASAADTPARLAVGANDLFLTAASGEATGLKWAGTYTSFTPSYAAITVGNGTNTGKYLQIGKFCHVVTRFTFGSTSSVTGSPLIQYLPITAANADYTSVGNAYFLDNGVGDYGGIVLKVTTSTVYFQSIGTAGTYANLPSLSSSVPFTWGTGDAIYLNYVYEVA